MKRVLSVTLILFFIINAKLFSAPFHFLKTEVLQADGSVLSLYASGDEYFHWLHDEDGYTIMPDNDGYYYYAVKDDQGSLVSSGIKAGQSGIENSGIPKWLKISEEKYLEKKNSMISKVSRIDLRERNMLKSTNDIPVLNNLVIYISFPDNQVFNNARNYYDQNLNNIEGQSLKNYYLEVSYNGFVIHSTHFPEPESSETASYIADNERGYYRVYNATTNPIGYQTEDQRTGREHNLLANSIRALKTTIESKFTAEELDFNNDGIVDNICFIIQGNSDGWSDLLWAHRWSLYTQEVYLHDKLVYDYVFQPENQMSVRTLCHEMFHALGAPDLYHYSSDPIISSLQTVGEWDLMESGFGHMGAYMKYKYGGFIDGIPEITSPGTYSLKPLGSGKENICYKIASSNPNEFYVLEYRKKEGLYESSIYGSGLLVYRINNLCYGNAQGPPDEIYIYRPSGSLTENGFINQAYYTSDERRPSIGGTVSLLTTFLSDGSDGGLRIKNVSAAEETISFEVTKMFTSIENISSSEYKIRSSGDRIILSNLKGGEQVFVYDSMGRMVYCRTVKESGDETINLQKGKIYIVRIDNYSSKIIH